MNENGRKPAVIGFDTSNYRTSAAVVTLNGEILVPCSQNEPVWFASLGQWQIHAALDIAGAPGEAIRACGDGIVGEAWKDPLWGNSIRLEHADGFVSTYSNLNTLNLVQTGSAVMAGDVIGSVGRSAAVESELPWHLHFEMRCGDTAVDFERLMSGEALDSGDGAGSDVDGSPGGSTGGAA